MRRGSRKKLFLLVLLEGSHEGGLLLVGLEPAVAELGGGVDKLELHVLQSSLLGVGQQTLTQGQDPPGEGRLHGTPQEGQEGIIISVTLFSCLLTIVTVVLYPHLSDPEVLIQTE